MSKKKFNPKDWASKGVSHTPTATNAPTVPFVPSNNPKNDIETITKRIEETATDIAPNYADWRDLGFALADALGEIGRKYYNRLSRFYSGYTETETNKQYDNCLKAHGHGVTIKTLYHLAKQANIDISTQNTVNQKNTKNQGSDKISKLPNVQNGNLAKVAISEQTDEEQETEILPTIPENIYPLLPDFLRQITEYANSREDADLLLLGSLIVTSACLPNVYGIYGGVTVFPNLFLFVSAQASAGKGRLSLCRRLVEPIHRQLRELNKLENEEYKRQQIEYNANKKNPDVEQPQEPPLRVLFVPANSSATAVFQILNDNAGVGLMFETEGDTLAQTFKSEHGNYSDGFRKAFHHEKISYLRRKDREYITLENPKLSALLSGTPRQVQSLIPDAENGLFSRFMFYCMNIRLQWIDVFAINGNESLDQRFDRFGNKFFDFYQTLKQYENIRFSLSSKQQAEFNAYFEQVQKQYWELLGNDYVGTIRRLGLITFRVAMVFTALRIMENGNIDGVLICSDTDFQIAMEILKVLLQHAAFVFKQLPHATATQTVSTNPKMALFQALPAQFDRAKYLEIASQLQIPESTANKQIARFCNAGLLIRQTHGNYIKHSE
ncbi:MAG: DUF3987 domain-containing protein [Bacteroidales bacterium]|jgi:hypothetical protein|nr:DUF3987 domain-containing protein [Bacteroidales bacterium]